MSAIGLTLVLAVLENALIYALAVAIDDPLAVSLARPRHRRRSSIGGVRFLTDPALTPRLAHLRRHHAVDLDAIGGVDVVLISHVHMDHLHVPSLRLLGDVAGDRARGRRTAAAAATGFRDVARDARRRRDHVRRGDGRDGPGRPLRPAAARTAGSRAAAVGYVLRSAHGSVYFAGDTDLFDEMADLGAGRRRAAADRRVGPDARRGPPRPRAGGRAATELIAPRLVVPIHWGTYSPVGVRRPTPGVAATDPPSSSPSAMDDAGHGRPAARCSSRANGSTSAAARRRPSTAARRDRRRSVRPAGRSARRGRVVVCARRSWSRS